MSFHAISQKTNKKNKSEPVYFLDSIRLDKITLFNPDKIESVNEINDGDTTAPGGKIYMKSKNPNDYKFLSIQDIAQLNNIEKNAPVILILDDHIVNDNSSIMIDSSYIVKMWRVQIEENSFVRSNLPDQKIIKIITPEYIDPKHKKKKKS
ncbi:hypothetical protein GCM10027043_28110 [Ferruginibacter profundus]